MLIAGVDLLGPKRQAQGGGQTVRSRRPAKRCPPRGDDRQLIGGLGDTNDRFIGGCTDTFDRLFGGRSITIDRFFGGRTRIVGHRLGDDCRHST